MKETTFKRKSFDLLSYAWDCQVSAGSGERPVFFYTSLNVCLRVEVRQTWNCMSSLLCLCFGELTKQKAG